MTIKLLHAAGSVTSSDWADYAMERLAIVLYFPHPVAVKANAVNDFKESDTRGYMGEKGNPITDGGGTHREEPRLFLEFSNQFHFGIGLFYQFYHSRSVLKNAKLQCLLKWKIYVILTDMTLKRIC